MARFWEDLGFLNQMGLDDKILVGKNADGTTMYTDLQAIYKKISQSNFAEVKPSFVASGANLGSPSTLKVYYARAGAYTIPSGTLNLSGSLNILTWDMSSWTYLELYPSIVNITSSSTSPTEVPAVLGQFGKYIHPDFSETWFAGRSTNSATSNKWDKIINEHELNLALIARLDPYVLKADMDNALTGDFQAVQIPKFRGETGYDTSGNWYLGRSYISGEKWRKLVDVVNLDSLILALNKYSLTASSVQFSNALLPITSVTIEPTEIATHIGQLGKRIHPDFNETWYASRSKNPLVKMWDKIINEYELNLALIARLEPYVLKADMDNPLTGDFQAVQIPKFRGETGYDTSGNWYLGRSYISGEKWRKLVDVVNLDSLILALNKYSLTASSVQFSNALISLPSSATAPTELGLFKGEFGVNADAEFNETPFYCRSTTAAKKWERLWNDYLINRLSIAQGARRNGDLITNSGVVVSKYDTEKYAHSAYVEIFGYFAIIPYMCNDSGTFEGAEGQIIRLSKYDIIAKKVVEIITVAVAGGTYGSLVLENDPLQTPNILRLSDTTARIFFRCKVDGHLTIAYRDYNVTTGTLSNGDTVKCLTKSLSTILPLTMENAYEHYDWLRGSTNALGSVYFDFFMTSDIRKMDDGSFCTCVSIGSGKDKVAGSIFAKSTDFGATWTLLASPNISLLPGVSGVDGHFFWEATMAENATHYFLFGRGDSRGNAGENGAAYGVWMVSTPKTGLVYTNSGFTRVWKTSNQKPCIFKNDGKLYLITQGATNMYGELGSLRTSLDIILITADFTKFTKVSEIVDADGFHSASTGQLKDTTYMVVSTSLTRNPQIREGVAQYHNTEQIKIVEINRKFLVQSTLNF